VRFLRAAVVPVIAVITALGVGAVLILSSGSSPLEAYGALVEGSFFGWEAWGTTLEKATPLIMGGLAVAFAFKAGLFNIGGQGQLLFGALIAGAVGYGFTGLPWIVHMPLALLLGAMAGAAWGAIPGVLKATRGAHEVITTIMLNFVAANMAEWLATKVWRAEGDILVRTPFIEDSAEIPTWGHIPLGFFIAVALACGTWFLLQRTTFGFEIRSVGLNPSAASYAGISVKRIIVLTMTISGFLAAVGGSIETLGVVGRYEPGFNAGLGFDGITIALLARTHPIAVIPAAILIAAMDASASLMQFRAGVAPEIVDVIEALILLFVATPIIVRWFLKGRQDEGVSMGANWGAS
jgi:simple sugar transport system permease protein